MLNSLMTRSSCALGALALSGAALAGQLAPPPGPVGPTMKPLDAIEPRICVSDLQGDATASHVISQSGSYYLTADVIGKGGSHGVRIDAPHVRLDLNGFDLVGVPGSLDAVHCSVACETIEICVGYSDNYLSSIGGWGGGGVVVTSARDVLVANLRVEDCGTDGLSIGTIGHVDHGSTVRIRNISSSGNGGDGVRVVTSVAAGSLADNAIISSRVRCVSNGGAGVRFTPTTPGSYVFDMRLTDAHGNASHGVSLEPASDTRLICGCSHLVAGDNGGSGLVLVGGSACKISTDYTDHDLSRNNLSGLSCDIGPGTGMDMRMVRVLATENQGDQTSITTADQCDVRVEKFNVKQEFGPQAGHRLTTGDNTLVSYRLDSCVVARCGTEGHSLSLGNGCVLTYSARNHTMFLNGSHGLSVSSGSSCVILGSLRSSMYASNGVGGVAGDGLRLIAGPGTSMRVGAESCVFDDNLSSGVHCVGDLNQDGRLDMVLCRSSGNGLHGVFGSSVSMSSSGMYCIANGGDGLHFDDTSTLGERTLRCESSTFSENGGAGVRGSKWIDKSSPIIMKSCTSSSNGGGGAIYLRGAITADRCVFNDNVGDGLRCESATVHTLDCECSGNTDDGIDYLDVDSDDDGVMCNDNGGYGMRCAAGPGTKARVETCEAKCARNARGGIRCESMECSVARCELSGNFGPGLECVSSRMYCSDLVCSSNTGDGVRLTLGGSLHLSGGTLRANGGHGLSYEGTTGGGGGGGRVVLRAVTASSNTSSGVRCLDGTCRLVDNDCDSNGVHGFEFVRCVVSASRCTGKDNNCNGFSSSGSDSTFERCDGMDNDCNGFESSDDNTLGLPVSSSMRCVSCAADRNLGTGFVYGACRDGEASMCSASSNGSSGIEVLSSSSHCVVSRCSVRSNGSNGIVVGSFGNTVVGCDATNHPIIAYDVPVPGNTFGPPVDEVTINQNCNPDRNLLR